MSRIERLEDRVAELEDAMGLTAKFPAEILPRKMFPDGQRYSFGKVQEVAGVLLKREYGDRSAIYDCLYGARPESQMPEMKTVDVLVSHVRKALRAHDVTITTIHGKGWYIDAANKAKLNALIAQYTEAA